jgi:hypothetical protein
VRKTVILLAVLSVLFLNCPVFAAKDSKGASAAAYEHAGEKSIFNRVSDWFATIGKSKEEKKRILTERQAEREAAKMKKEAEHLKKKSEKKGKKFNEKMKEHFNKALNTGSE